MGAMKAPPVYKGRQLEDGYFPVPHYLFDLCETTKHQVFMINLLRCENRWTGKTEGWFHISDERLAKMCHMGKRQVCLCRDHFLKLKTIEVNIGGSHMETEYRIIWGSAKLKSNDAN